MAIVKMPYHVLGLNSEKVRSTYAWIEYSKQEKMFCSFETKENIILTVLFMLQNSPIRLARA